jgi:hypothetical protein
VLILNTVKISTVKEKEKLEAKISGVFQVSTVIAS